MKLSVIIPCFKFKDYIQDCVDSVLNQITNFEFEILISDDYSSDGTNELLYSIYKDNSKVKILTNLENKGALENISLLLNSCKGEYVMYIDGDDYFIDVNYFQRAINFLDANKEYVMYSTGYNYLHSKGEIDNSNFKIGLKQDVSINDLLNNNYITFGRVFKRFDNLIKYWMKDLPYPDWAINYEILKHGLARCELNFCSGIYRLTETGMITQFDETEKSRRFTQTMDVINTIHANKIISIIDCFVYNDNIANKLRDAIQRLRKFGHDVMLITNTPVDKDIISSVDYLFYDHRNPLFTLNKYKHNGIDYWKNMGTFEVHDYVPHLQRHGLSVLTNIFRSIKFAKQLGYTHFQRFEVDDLFGEKSVEWIKKVPYIVFEKQKKGLFYINENNNPPDFSFHYFFCEINYFLENSDNIECEEDYDVFLTKHNSDKTFIMAEEYMFKNFSKCSDLILREGNDLMKCEDFPDTAWNTEVSPCNLDKKYEKCSTKIYKNFSKYKNESMCENDNYVVLSYNYSDNNRNRIIVAEFEDGSRITIFHTLGGKHCWQFDYINKNVKFIEVYENEKLLYKENISEVSSYICYNI